MIIRPLGLSAGATQAVDGVVTRLLRIGGSRRSIGEIVILKLVLLVHLAQSRYFLIELTFVIFNILDLPLLI